MTNNQPVNKSQDYYFTLMSILSKTVKERTSLERIPTAGKDAVNDGHARESNAAAAAPGQRQPEPASLTSLASCRGEPPMSFDFSDAPSVPDEPMWTSATPSIVQQHANKFVGLAAAMGIVVGLLIGGGGGGGDAAAAPASAMAGGGAPCSARALSSWGHAKISDDQREKAALASFSPRVRSLLGGMSLAQKIGQMTQFNLDEAFADNANFKSTPEFADAPWTLLDEELIRSYTGAPNHVGSWLNSPFSDDSIREGTNGNKRSFLNATEWRLIIDRLQAITIEDGAPPMVFGVDSVHGAVCESSTVHWPYPPPRVHASWRHGSRPAAN